MNYIDRERDRERDRDRDRDRERGIEKFGKKIWQTSLRSPEQTTSFIQPAIKIEEREINDWLAVWQKRLDDQI